MPRLLSIGDIAEATGVSPDTIRVWERRYGRPEPVRLPSGHRRYTEEHVRWLRRVTEALARGHRAGTVVRADESELDRMLEGVEAADVEPKEVRALLARVGRYDLKGLTKALRGAHDSLGTDRFLEERVAPLVEGVGRAWADGELDVRHEHFLSEVLEDVLRSIRVRRRARKASPLLLLATLPGEPHGIGLQMVALTCAEVRLATRILGTETPLEEISGAVRETGAAVVGISVSLATGGIETDRRLAELRKMLPQRVQIVVGGRGARGVRRGVRGVDYVEGLSEFGAWACGL